MANFEIDDNVEIVDGRDYIGEKGKIVDMYGPVIEVDIIPSDYHPGGIVCFSAYELFNLTEKGN